MATLERRIELRVGFFVMSALLIGAALAFMIGNQRNLWRSKTDYTVVFEDVAGLRPGGPVQLAGVDVGTVTKVEFGDDGKIQVTLGIVDKARRLIRGPLLDEQGNVKEPGTEATIGSKGFLGDMQVNLSVGKGPELDPGTAIPPGAPKGFGAIMEQADTITSQVGDITTELSEEQVAQKVSTLLDGLSKVAALLAKEDGSFNRLLSDPRTAENLDAALRNMSAMTLEISRTARSARLILDEVRHGNGGAHELIYGQESARLVASGADALGEIASSLQAIRSGNGAAHELLYGEDGGEIVANLEAATADIAAIAHAVREGDGTLGALLTDPSVYEDVKRLVGDLERNEILRALVRYSITADETGESPAVSAEERDSPAP